MPSTHCNIENAWICVNTDALRHNARLVLGVMQKTSSSVPRLMAVVKANGYGHGAAIAAHAFKEGGATWFGVTSFAEASELVESGIDSSETPILVFSPPVTVEQCKLASKYNLHVTVCDSGHVELLLKARVGEPQVINVHLKVDTGMGRLGLMPLDASKVASLISGHSALKLVGVYTHFGTALSKEIRTMVAQFKIFQKFCDDLHGKGLDGFLRHCANSAALLRLPECRLDMVRAGTILYGQYPSPEVPRINGLNVDTCHLSVRTVFVHTLPAGASIGYGAEYKTTRPTIAAVLPVGFADGVSMQPSSVTKGIRGIRSAVANIVSPKTLSVKFGSFSAPVLGRVAMQMIVVDVTDSPVPVKLGDAAIVPARRLAISALVPRLQNYEGLE